MLIYNLKAVMLLWRRYVSAVLALAVSVALALLVIAGIDSLSSVVTGFTEKNNAIVVGRGAAAENYPEMVRVPRDLINPLSTLPGIAKAKDGTPLISTEYMINAEVHVEGAERINVVIRGVTEKAYEVHTSVSGTVPRNGAVVGPAARRALGGLETGATMNFAGRDWKVTGFLNPTGGETPFDSEIWVPLEALMQAKGATDYGIVTLRLDVPVSQVISAFEGNEILKKNHRMLPEENLRKQWNEAVLAYKTIGNVLLVLLFIVASVGSLNLLLNNVLRRRRDIALLRSMGYNIWQVTGGFMVEGMIVAVIGTVIGLLCTIPFWGYPLPITGLGRAGVMLVKLQIGASSVILSLLVALTLGAVAALGPSLYCARLNIRDEFQRE